jgi:hypothetical protein
MKVFLSTWKPWTTTTISLQDRVDMAKEARAEICMKGSNGTGLYGPNTWLIFKIPPYKGKSNDDLELTCKQSDNNVKVQLWCFPYLKYPQGSADAVNEAITRWNPTDVFLDAEGWWAKDYPSNTGPFLRALGDVKVRFWLQSYRRPDYHPQIQWEKWLTYVDSSSQFIIHGLGPQAYPLDSQDFVSDYTRMVAAYAELLDQVGRPDMPWFPTMPTFSQGGWTPTVEAMMGGCDYLIEELGDRLIGFNFWRQEYLFKPEWIYMLRYINTLASDVPQPPQPIPQNVYIHDHLHPWAVTEGYDGPSPDVS